MTKRKQSTRTTDVHRTITDTIIAAIEAGQTTTGMPWVSAGGLPIKLSDGTPYQGVNVLHLWCRRQPSWLPLRAVGRVRDVAAAGRVRAARGEGHGRGLRRTHGA